MIVLRHFFIELAHVGVHAEKGDLLKARDEKENDKIFGYIEDLHRRHLAGALQAVDESVGKVIAALREKKLLDNTVVLFISDNGRATQDDPDWQLKNSASNWPLRGV